MKFRDAIDQYISDMRSEGRISSVRTVRSYRHTLERHADDVENRDPALTHREDVKRTLKRWPNASVETTRGTYVGRLSLDEIARGVAGVSYNPASTQFVLPPQKEPQMPSKAPTGIEPVQTASRPAARDLGKLLMDLRGAFANVG